MFETCLNHYLFETCLKNTSFMMKCSNTQIVFKQVRYNFPVFLQTCFKVFQCVSMCFDFKHGVLNCLKVFHFKSNVSSQKKHQKAPNSQSLLVKHLFEASKHIKHRNSYCFNVFQSVSNCFKHSNNLFEKS